MSYKENLTAYRIFLSFCFFSLISLGTNAQTVTRTWNGGGTLQVDGSGNYAINVGSVNFNAADFSSCSVTDVNVRIRWTKTDGSCASPGTGNSFHNETSFRLQGPDGTQVILVQPGTYSGGTTIAMVTTTFNQGSGLPSGTPSTGTFGPNNGNLNNYNGKDPTGSWTLFAGDNAGGDPLCIDWFQVTVTSSGGQAAEQGFGCGQWNVNVYDGRDFNLGGGTTIFGNYTEPNLSYDSRNRWASGSTPADASGYTGCDPGIDNHTVVSKRTCFTCDVYQIDVPNHDDEVKLFVDGAEVWSFNGCCASHTNVWTGILDNSSNVEFRHAEGGGGSHQGLTLTAVTTALDPGSHNTTAITGCQGYNPPTLGGTGFSGTNQEASGGTSTTVAGGTSTYQWQVNGVNIGGATGITYNPPAINVPGTYSYSRRVTDRCGNTANTTAKVITIVPDPSVSLAGATSFCPGGTATLTATPSDGTGTCQNIWQSSPDNATWTTIVTNTSNTYTTPALNSSMYYRVIRTCSGSGCTDANSNSQFVEVLNCCDIALNGITSTDESCPGYDDGSIVIDAFCTSCASVEYSIDNGGAFQASPVFTNVPDGNYTIVIRDSADPTCNDGGTTDVNPGIDNTAPVFSNCPADITMSSSVGVCDVAVTWTPPTAEDNCPPATLSSGGFNFTYIGTHNGSFYYYSDAPLVPASGSVGDQQAAFASAQAAAAGINGYIATVDDDAENTFISEATSQSTLIGYTDEGIEGAFGWIGSCCGGSGTAYTNWNGGEPNDAGGEDYVEVSNTTGQWNDVDIFLSSRRFVVESPGPLPFTNITSSHNPGDIFPVGITTVTYSADDGNGNIGTCSFDVNITLDGTNLELVLDPNSVCSNEGVLTSQTGGSPVVGSNPGDSGTYSGLGVTDNGNGSFDLDLDVVGIGTHTINYTYEDGAGCSYFINSTIDVLGTPSASITCPDAVMRDCQGPFNCSPTDINPGTLPTSTGSVSGSAAAYVYGNPNPGGDLFIDLPNVPTNTQLELIYTLTSPDGCVSTASCTFEVTGKQANAGKY